MLRTKNKKNGKEKKIKLIFKLFYNLGWIKMKIKLSLKKKYSNLHLLHSLPMSWFSQAAGGY